MPVRDFLESDDGDLAVVNGDFAFVGGDTTEDNVAAVKQSARIRVNFFLGECFLDESQGVDWLGKILIKGANPIDVDAELSDALASVPDVQIVKKVSAVGPSADRVETIDYELVTAYTAAPIIDAIGRTS